MSVFWERVPRDEKIKRLDDGLGDVVLAGLMPSTLTKKYSVLYTVGWGVKQSQLTAII